jgi:hypothetical protein
MMKKILIFIIIAIPIFNCTNGKHLKPGDALVGKWYASEEATLMGPIIIRSKSEVIYKKDGSFHENGTTWIMEKDTEEKIVTLKDTSTGKWIIENNKLKTIYANITISSFASSDPEFTLDMFEQVMKEIINRPIEYEIVGYSTGHFRIKDIENGTVTEMKKSSTSNVESEAVSNLKSTNSSKEKVTEEPSFSDEDYEKHYEKKQKALEAILGKMHGFVGHAIIPFQLGGAVDMYYFPKTEYGMGFVTMELIEPDGSGPMPDKKGKTYELIAFTKEKYNEDKNSQFSKIERRICGIFTLIGNYSYEVSLNPKETCEIPGKEKNEETKCLIFDEYINKKRKFMIDNREHTLLICIEVFRSEMKYAMKNGTDKLIKKLKEKGHYPYSDLDRDPVI